MYRIPANLRSWSSIDKAIKANPEPAKSLLGASPLNEYHRMRKARNAVAHPTPRPAQSRPIQQPSAPVELSKKEQLQARMAELEERQLELQIAKMEEDIRQQEYELERRRSTSHQRDNGYFQYNDFRSGMLDIPFAIPVEK